MLQRHKRWMFGWLLLGTLALVSCSTHVPLKDLYGSYVASYPFGKEELTLNPDFTFVQKVTIHGQKPTIAHGQWKFDSINSSADSYVDLYGSMWVVDGFDHLRSDWRKINPGMTASLPAELLWFRVTLNSGGDYPYVKQ